MRYFAWSIWYVCDVIFLEMMCEIRGFRWGHPEGVCNLISSSWLDESVSFEFPIINLARLLMRSSSIAQWLLDGWLVENRQEFLFHLINYRTSIRHRNTLIDVDHLLNQTENACVIWMNFSKMININAAGSLFGKLSSGPMLWVSFSKIDIRNSEEIRFWVVVSTSILFGLMHPTIGIRSVPSNASWIDWCHAIEYHSVISLEFYTSE